MKILIGLVLLGVVAILTFVGGGIEPLTPLWWVILPGWITAGWLIGSGLAQR